MNVFFMVVPSVASQVSFSRCGKGQFAGMLPQGSGMLRSGLCGKTPRATVGLKHDRHWKCELTGTRLLACRVTTRVPSYGHLMVDGLS